MSSTFVGTVGVACIQIRHNDVSGHKFGIGVLLTPADLYDILM